MTTELAYGIAPPTYRLPGETTPGRVALQVSDLGRSTEFYEKLLGLVVLDRAGARALLGAPGEEDTTVLLELREKPGINPVMPRGVLGLYHYAILLPDRAALGRLLRHLADTGVEVGASDHLVSEAIYLQDPDNLGIEVYVDRPRDAWRVEKGQLAMSTKPLDIRDVVTAAGGERWQGVPAGTRIGHLHLHVGDLEVAEAFYHRALGLDKMVWSYPGALFLSAGGYHHHLGVNTWARGARSASDEDARLLEWQLVLPSQSDVEAAAASIDGARYPLRREGRDVVVRDPWGTQLRLIAL